MKSLKFSILSLLMLMTIIGMAVCIYVQKGKLIESKGKIQRMSQELGEIATKDSTKISVRPLAHRGINSWRFRINKPHGDFEYCMGIATLSESGVPILPEKYRQYFQIIESDTSGEVEVVFSLGRGEKNSKWLMHFQEFQGDAVKIATATRVDGFRLKETSFSWRRPAGLEVQNDLVEMDSDAEKNGEVTHHVPDEIVWLFRSNLQQQNELENRAFVIAIRPSKKDIVPVAD